MFTIYARIIKTYINMPNMNIIAFFHKNFKPVMIHYYKIKYRWEIYKMLTFFEYHHAYNHFDVIKKMTLDEDKWSLEKSTKIFGICVYCGFLAPRK